MNEVTNPVSDYNVKVIVRNGRLLAKIRAAGYQSGKAFAAACGVSYGTLANLVALRLTGMKNDNEWRGTVLKVSDFLCCMPEDIIPPQHWRKPLVRNTFEAEMTGVEAASLIASPSRPDSTLLRQEFLNQLTNTLQALPPREERVLRLRFGLDCDEHTLAEIAELMGVTPSRIREIEGRALRRMRRVNARLRGALDQCWYGGALE